MATETQRIPAALWSSLQEICYRQDQIFLQDVSRLIGVPAIDIKRRVLGVRGVPTRVEITPETSGPWWTATQCPLMEQTPGNMWRRCGMYCEANGTCWEHRVYRLSPLLRHYDDPYFKTLRKRRPVRYKDRIYWVDSSNTVLDDKGVVVDDMTIDLNTRTVYTNNEYESSSES